MKIALTPLPIMAAAVSTMVVLAAAVIWLAQAQPWTGMRLAATQGGTDVVVLDVAPGGPAAIAGLRPGDRIAAIAGVTLTEQDLVEEPDTLRSYDDMRRFFARQGQFHDALRSGAVTVGVSIADGERLVMLHPAQSRPLATLPVAFWLQVITSAAGMLIGLWVWSLRIRDAAAQLTAVAGTALAVMVFPAAVYSTRDLALPSALFRALAALDHYGAFAFGVAMVSLFYIYPHQIISLRKLLVLPLVMGVWWLADTLRIVFPGPPTGFHLAAFLMLLAFLPAALMQHRLSRHDPGTRAALRWFTLAVAFGTGTFVALVVLPNLFGLQQLTSQANAFVLLLIVFAGIGLSVARYRLFELENWAFGLLYNLAAVIAIFALDALLIFVLAVNRVGALSLALIVVLLAYLPVRDMLRRRHASSEVQQNALFQRVVDVALTPPDLDQNQRWADLLRAAYDPLHLAAGDPVSAPQIVEDGLGLALPAVGGVAAVRLGYARGGRRLFSRADAALARELCAMLAHALESRHAREAGVAEERARIARDMHDNIGAKLLSALHCAGADRKDTMIRDALADFRDIINDTSADARSLEEALADLRVECAERLEAAQIALDWHADEDGRTMLTANAVHTLRSILREAVSNVIRHADARRVVVRVRCDLGRIELSVQDDGRGFLTQAATPAGHGHGLTNIRTRLEALNGNLRLNGSRRGTQLIAAFSVG
ncbi:ATP-binding protein [Fertoebacter nigrum]|uniref:histidine kinase n=1 Tax=Fertoeibacter niger TaxID=2656921 RepID=A0A8X8GWZ4_9RHOB|nr:ATP-binding protein [Fertoeibacter niger]NUB45843.1 ATP-binding protein [Fertoeibacter niger]